MKDMWPVIPGAYAVGDPSSPVAVCTLGSDALFPTLAARDGIAIAGALRTANLGIEDLVVNVTANPRIRFLIVCGEDSPIFKQGQTLRALVKRGLSPERAVVGAEGFNAVLRNVTSARVDAFRSQVEIIDRTGDDDPDRIATIAAECVARDPGPFAAPITDDAPSRRSFVEIEPGGRREPLWYDPKGFFVITTDAGQIVVRHYERDYTPAHEMRSHSGEAILLGLLREELVSQLTHAGYLGRELAKAETALRLGLVYAQDRPLARA